MKRELANQYNYALTMLKDVVNETDDSTWLYSDEKKVAAWQIAYHAVFYANIYCSSSEEQVKRWDEQTDLDHFFETPWPPHQRRVPEHAMAKADIIEFIDFVLGVIPEYLEHLEPDKPCWPHLVQAESVRVPPEQSPSYSASHGPAYRAKRRQLMGWPGSG